MSQGTHMICRNMYYIIQKYLSKSKLSYNLIDELCILSGLLEFQPSISVTMLMLQRRNFVSICIPYKKLSVGTIFCKVIFGHFSWMKSWIAHIEITQIHIVCTKLYAHIFSYCCLKNNHFRKSCIWIMRVDKMVFRQID